MILGKAEVDSSILSGGTIFPLGVQGLSSGPHPTPHISDENGTGNPRPEVGDSGGPRSVGVLGSDLYRRVIQPDESFDRINQRVWRGTPWVVDAFTGSHRAPDDRFREMAEWCRERFGDEAWPFSDTPRPGRWKIGGATVFGWTWFGFATEAEMREFEAAFPAPARAAE